MSTVMPAVEGGTRLQSHYNQGEESVNILASAERIYQSQATVSVTETPVQPTSELITSPTGKLRFTNDDLPRGTYKKWTNTFIPSYIEFMDTQRDPFSLSSLEISSAMQEAWDIIYPGTPFNIQPRTCVFLLVSPCF
jgi:hypothetical protein